LWPNLLLEARRRGVPVAVANARLGERSHRGYRRIRRLLAPALAAVKWWGAQSKPIADRLRDLARGLDTTVAVTGSMKYDGAPTDRRNPATLALRQLLGIDESDQVFVAGSTQGDEERIVLDAWRQAAARHPNLKLVIVPRHPERFPVVAELLANQGIPFVRRTALPNANPAAVTLLDTVGELRATWGLADFGFVGGSFGCGRGGQSMIEPAGYGVAVCFGPEVWNFQDTVDKLLAAQAARLLPSPDWLAPALEAWLADPTSALAMGERARGFVASQLGAVAATADALAALSPPTLRRRAA
jgi:3-deoxy-D-manno-octulosonic-acid transferase